MVGFFSIIHPPWQNNKNDFGWKWAVFSIFDIKLACFIVTHNIKNFKEFL